MTSSLSQNRPKILVVTPDVLGEKMAGPAIRALEIAKALHRIAKVTLLSTVRCDLPSPGFEVAYADEPRLRSEIAAHDVLIFQGHTLTSFPWIVESDIVIVADLYDPMQIELLEHDKHLPVEERIDHTIKTVEVLNVQIERADFMLCASERQRDLWLGHLGALCRINHLTYDADPSLRTLIDVAPFGVQEPPPQRQNPAIKGVVPGISATDKVVLWGGGIYNWFDPLTLIRAVATLAPTHPDLRLFFLGVQHPNPHVPEMQMVTDARALAEELNLTDTHVFFNREWVDYEQRADYLLDADVGVSTHFDRIETEFSFRTRILDYLWAGLPIVATDGDHFADLVQRHDLGLVVPPEDINALASALESALYAPDHDRFAQNSQNLGKTMTWSQTLRPLIEFCTDPRHAADYRGPVVALREQEREHLHRRIADLESSTSWRITQPLRAISGRRTRNTK